VFSEDEVCGPFEFVEADVARPIATPAPGDVGSAAQQLRGAGVSEIVLVHGTFAGNDVAGIMREISRFSPRHGRQLRELEKRWFDELTGEVANYAESFAITLSDLINPAGEEPIRVRRFHWSGENHHLGRAGGAMSLLDWVMRDRDVDGRMLIMAHSHGGNVVAMLSQLLGSPVEVRRAFFDATRLHFSQSFLGGGGLPDWQRCEQHLCQDEDWTLPPIDVATFGTPLRYRWKQDRCPNLLHFVQHRWQPNADRPELAMLPTSVNDLICAAGGDYVQHIGIAGTDFLPSIFAWRDWVVDCRLGKMFEWDVGRRDLIRRLRMGRRVSSDGTTLLVDYADCQAGWNRKVLGHGVYTCSQWLPFHLREIVNRFYGSRER
jgi:hypothetical protein